MVAFEQETILFKSVYWNRNGGPVSLLRGHLASGPAQLQEGEVGEKSDEKTWESVTWKYNSHSTTVFVTVVSCVEVTLIL